MSFSAACTGDWGSRCTKDLACDPEHAVRTPRALHPSSIHSLLANWLLQDEGRGVATYLKEASSYLGLGALHLKGLSC